MKVSFYLEYSRAFGVETHHGEPLRDSVFLEGRKLQTNLITH